MALGWISQSQATIEGPSNPTLLLPSHEPRLFSDNLLHVFMRCKRFQDHVVVAVCRKSANIGMVLAKSRMMLSKVEAAF